MYVLSIVVCPFVLLYPWSFVTQIFQNGQPSHGGDRKIFEVMTSTLPKGTLRSVTSLLGATLYQINPDRNHKLWNIVSTERYIYSICRCCWNVATYKWKVHNGKIWQHICYVWWMCFSTDSQHIYDYKLCSSSRWLVPLFVWGRLHTGAGKFTMGKL
jgi:hypothetical protein